MFMGTAVVEKQFVPGETRRKNQKQHSRKVCCPRPCARKNMDFAAEGEKWLHILAHLIQAAVSGLRL
jgi:hypothetical protein